MHTKVSAAKKNPAQEAKPTFKKLSSPLGSLLRHSMRPKPQAGVTLGSSEGFFLLPSRKKCPQASAPPCVQGAHPRVHGGPSSHPQTQTKFSPPGSGAQAPPAAPSGDFPRTASRPRRRRLPPPSALRPASRAWPHAPCSSPPWCPGSRCSPRAGGCGSC
jgi:hypothetical protein